MTMTNLLHFPPTFDSVSSLYKDVSFLKSNAGKMQAQRASQTVGLILWGPRENALKSFAIGLSIALEGLILGPKS